MTRKQGSSKAGPSKVYIQMLTGKVSSKKYADTVKRSNSLRIRRAAS